MRTNEHNRFTGQQRPASSHVLISVLSYESIQYVFYVATTLVCKGERSLEGGGVEIRLVKDDGCGGRRPGAVERTLL